MLKSLLNESEQRIQTYWLGIMKNKKKTKYITMKREDPPFFNWNPFLDVPNDLPGRDCVVIQDDNCWWQNMRCVDYYPVICRFDDC